MKTASGSLVLQPRPEIHVVSLIGAASVGGDIARCVTTAISESLVRLFRAIYITIIFM